MRYIIVTGYHRKMYLIQELADLHSLDKKFWGIISGLLLQWLQLDPPNRTSHGNREHNSNNRPIKNAAFHEPTSSIKFTIVLHYLCIITRKKARLPKKATNRTFTHPPTKKSYLFKKQESKSCEAEK